MCSILRVVFLNFLIKHLKLNEIKTVYSEQLLRVVNVYSDPTIWPAINEDI